MSIYRLKTTESINDFARRVLQHLQQFRDKLDDPRQDLERMDISQDEVLGTLSVRSDNTSGQVTANSEEHGLVSNQSVNLFWAGGSRINVQIGTINNVVNLPFSGGTGDNLPVQSTAITVVYYATLSALLGSVDANGQPDAAVAYAVRNEIASMISVVETAIINATAKIVEYQE